MSVDLVHLPAARDLATKRVVKYGLVATALVPVFETPQKNENEGSDRTEDAIETVDPDWGEGIEEKDFSWKEMMMKDPKRTRKGKTQKTPKNCPKNRKILGIF